MGPRLLTSPPNAVSLLKSFGYRPVDFESEAGSSAQRGHIIRAHRASDQLPVVVKCILRESPEARTLAYFQSLQTRGERLPIPDILDLIGDPSSNIILAVQEDWGDNLAELGPLSPQDFFDITRQCFEAVATLHAKGIAHLDISRYNFVCNSRRRVAIIDYDMTHYSDLISSKRERQSSKSHMVYPRRTTETPPEFRTEGADERRYCAYKLDIFALGVLILRFAKSSGFDCPQLILLVEPLIECDPALRPTAAEAVLWFQKWSEMVGIATSS